MTTDDLDDERSGELTLVEAEKRFHESVELLGWATDEFRARIKAGDLPDTADVGAMRKELGEA